MSGDTAISWTDRVWNPVVGCAKVSQGCKNCYAFDVHGARHKAFQEGKLQNVPQYRQPFSTLQLLPDRLPDPLKWRTPRRVFVNSMSDLFHPEVPDAYIDLVFGVMVHAATRHGHTFQVLTKRPQRMSDYLNDERRRWKVAQAYAVHFGGDPKADQVLCGAGAYRPLTHPGIWLGTSVEDQAAADLRIPALLTTPAAVRFLSCEPLLGPVDLLRVAWPDKGGHRVDVLRFGYWTRHGTFVNHSDMHDWSSPIQWVIAGGESGRHARPMQAAWARALRDQCAEASVPFHFKQWGAFDAEGRRAPGGRGWPHRELDGQVHDGFPQVCA